MWFEFERLSHRCSSLRCILTKKYIGKLPGLTNEFQRSMVFEAKEFERPKFDCTTILSKFTKLVQ